MMASACVNAATLPAESFLDCTPPYSSYGWLSPRISFSRDFSDDGPKISGEKPNATPTACGSSPEKLDPEASGKDFVEFEFRLDDPVAMLPADELFYDGKLVPLQLATARREAQPAADVRPGEPVNSRRRADAFGSDPYALSPRAPRCSSRWRELLGLKKQLQSPKPELQKAVASAPNYKSLSSKSLKYFLHRSSKSSPIDLSLSLPLLRDSDSESLSISSRLSLSSSSSSGPDHEDLPRLSLDSDHKPNLQVPISLNRNPPRLQGSRPRSECHVAAVRVGRSPVRRAPDTAAAAPPPRGSSVDSPRMNASGKIVFQGLERSSSTPGSFNGGGPPRPRPRGMERSYSANVRVTPVLNVPVYSLRGSAFGFGQLFSPQKKERDESSAARNFTTNAGCTSGKIRIERPARD